MADKGLPKLLKHYLTHPFLHDNAFSVAIGLGTHVLNYLLILLSLRLMTPAEFGRLGALVNCLLLVSVAAGALQVHTAQHLTAVPQSMARGLYHRILRKTLAWSLGAVAVSIPSQPFFASLLNVSFSELATLSLVGVASLVTAVSQGAATAFRKVRFLAAVVLFATIIKLGAAVLLLYVGASVIGVLTAYAIACGLQVLLTIQRLPNWERPVESTPTTTPLPPLTLFSTYFFLICPFALDQVYVQAFAPSVSGEYGALSSLSKFVFYVLSPIVSVTYAYLINLQGDRPAFRRFAWAAIAVTAGLGSCLTFALAAAPESALTLIISDDYQPTLTHLPVAAATYLLYSVAYITVTAAIAAGDRRIPFPLAAVSLAQLLLFALFTSGLASIVWIQFAVNVLFVLLVLPLGSALFGKMKK